MLILQTGAKGMQDGAFGKVPKSLKGRLGAVEKRRSIETIQAIALLKSVQ